MSLCSSSHPMVPLATLSVEAGHVSALAAPQTLEVPALACGSCGGCGEAAAPEPLTGLGPLPALPVPGMEGELALVGEHQLPAPPSLAVDGPASPAATYSLFAPTLGPPPGLCPDMDADGISPDFLGRLDHLKSLFRISATQEPISIMIHKVGPMLILDDGPRGWSRGSMDQPLPPLPDSDAGGWDRDRNSQLMLAELDPLSNSFSQVVTDDMPPPGLPPASRPVPATGSQLCVKNTFIDLVEEAESYDDPDELLRTRSAPPRMSMAPGSPMHRAQDGEWHMPVAPLLEKIRHEHMQRKGLLHDPPHLQQPLPEQVHEKTDVGAWSLIPYQQPGGDAVGEPCHHPGIQDAATNGQSSVLNRLLQLATPRKIEPRKELNRMSDAMSSLFAGIPPQPTRFGRAVEWNCGPFKVLLGCDLLVYRSDSTSPLDSGSDFASFKLLPPGRSGLPSRDERLDVYLENLMCDIKKAVWGLHDHGGETSWRVFNTNDLPGASPRPVPPRGSLPAPLAAEENFDEKMLVDQGQRLLHFLRQQCIQEGGTYWLYREQNSSAVELFDLSFSGDPTDDVDSWKSSRAFTTSQSLVLPIASLCLHLAKQMPDSDSQRRLLQKAAHLLEPVLEEHPGAFSMAALQLACSLMRTPVAAIPDKPSRPAARGRAARGAARSKAGAETPAAAEPPAAARLSKALHYLESIIGLLSDPCDDGTPEEVTFHAELLLQANVAYAECILTLVREAIIPTYSAWLAEVQRACGSGGNGAPVSNAILAETKRLSAALLLWRLFWLVRARRALAFLSQEKRETECWIIERDLCETMGDALYGLSRYPADDANNLLSGKMATADGICQLAEEGLRSWGLHGTAQLPEQPPTPAPRQKQKGSKRISSPVASAATAAVPANSPRRASAATAFVDGGSKSRSCSGSPAGEPHNMTAMYLSRLNPLKRGTGDEKLREDPLVQDAHRMGLWSKGHAFKQALALFEQAASRLRRRARQHSPSFDESSGSPSGGGATGIGATGAASGAAKAGGPGHRSSLHHSDEATIKIARKLAHLYNEEARGVLVQPGGTHEVEAAEELLRQAHHWMTLSGDNSNASRVLLNLSELYLRQAESRTSNEPDAPPMPFTEEQYQMWAKAVECCEGAAKLSDGALGRREGAFAHLRIGVHLSVRVPGQLQLADNRRRMETLSELADRHFGKALDGFSALKDEREVAVCHFHMADLALQEQQVPGASPPSKARLTSALRHARRSAEYWERMGVWQYAKDFLAAHIRTARLFDKQPKRVAFLDALEHLDKVESQMLGLVKDSDLKQRSGQSFIDKSLLTLDASGKQALAVPALRREMGKLCQAALREGGDTERAKGLYRRVLRNEALFLERS